MSTSQRTFDQVKNILGMLDRNIDAARAKRTQVRAPMPIAATTAPMAAAITPSTLIGVPAAPAPAPSVAPSGQGHTGPTARSVYGRAQPMRPTPRGNDAGR